MIEIAYAKSALPRAGALVVLVPEGAQPSGLWHEADEAMGGAIGRALAAASFTGKAGSTCVILAPGAGLARVVAVGLGRELPTRRALEEAGGHAAASLGADEQAAIAADPFAPDQAAQIALGAVLRTYRFDKYRTKEKPEDKPRLAKITVLTNDPARARTAWEREKPLAEGVFLARDLASEPANVLTPTELARRCEALTEIGLKVDVCGPKDLAKLGFGAMLGVSQGSAEEPRMVILRWNGETAAAKAQAENGETKAKRPRTRPVAFIGKGVTFDTGGISIKPAANMEDMKWDMAGAAAVIGVMAALAGRRARVDAVGLVGLVENMPSGTAQRPGDVVRSASGQTIEVINTDAEGRLVLADVLHYAREKYDPVLMIDLATLTGAIIVGLGHEYAGLFASDDGLAGQLAAAGAETGELVWRMPLHEEFDKALKSDIADMKNVGGRPGGAIAAAMFLKRFVDGRPWAHLDIAGTAWTMKDRAVTPKGASGFGVRLLDRLVAEHYEGR